ncbi:MAG: DEAD/DEAH box helicase [Gammaproteobacteria bacterium]
MISEMETGCDYSSFLDSKLSHGIAHGFAPITIPEYLFDFQKAILTWAVEKGRAAIFADCGLGKTPLQLCWAENIVRKTKKSVLILTPLAVSAQTIEEAHKFDISATRSSGELPDKPGIIVTNYEKLRHFRASDFIGVVCDESSILKSFDGVRRAEITAFMRAVPYRLLCTATAAPNDYTELGTSSEALGYLGYVDMLNRFFINDMKNSATGRQHGKSATWRMKGHAESSYWRWVVSWARAVRKPSDLGFENGAFELPPLVEREHIVAARALADGQLFTLPALDLRAQREERRRTIQERCETAAALVANTGRPALLWCDLNDEGNLLERLIPDAVQVSGSDSDDDKEDRLLGFAQGRYRVLVTKKRIGAWGLNFQNCAHEVYFPSHSYEQYYQAVRRCWRFGQTQSVVVDCVMTEGERIVMHNLQSKARAADAMFSSLVACMNDEMHIGKGAPFHSEEEIPSWL